MLPHDSAGANSGIQDERSLLAVMDIVLQRQTNTIDVRQRDGMVQSWNKERMDSDIIKTASAVRKYEAKVRASIHTHAHTRTHPSTRTHTATHEQ